MARSGVMVAMLSVAIVTVEFFGRWLHRRGVYMDSAKDDPAFATGFLVLLVSGLAVFFTWVVVWWLPNETKWPDQVVKWIERRLPKRRPKPVSLSELKSSRETPERAKRFVN